MLGSWPRSELLTAERGPQQNVQWAYTLHASDLNTHILVLNKTCCGTRQVMQKESFKSAPLLIKEILSYKLF